MHHRSHRLAAIACVLALAGCGGGASSAVQFKAGYASARRPLNRTFSEATKALVNAPRTGVAETARSIGALAVRFRKDLAPLEALTPPAAVSTAFITLTSSLNRVASDLQGVSLAAGRRDAAGALLAYEQLGSDASAANQAAAVVKQKLYAK